MNINMFNTRIHLQIWLFFFHWIILVFLGGYKLQPPNNGCYLHQRHFNWPCARNIASCAKGVVSSSKMRATARSSEPVDNRGAKQRSTWWWEVGHDGWRLYLKKSLLICLVFNKSSCDYRIFGYLLLGSCKWFSLEHVRIAAWFLKNCYIRFAQSRTIQQNATLSVH